MITEEYANVILLGKRIGDMDLKELTNSIDEVSRCADIARLKQYRAANDQRYDEAAVHKGVADTYAKAVLTAKEHLWERQQDDPRKPLHI